MKTPRFKDYRWACYGIFKRLPSGNLLGYTEQSFSMSWNSNVVRAWVSFPRNKQTQKESKAELLSFLNKERNELAKRHPTCEVFIARLDSKSCPVNVDLHSKPEGKFDYRNRKFITK